MANYQWNDYTSIILKSLSEPKNTKIAKQIFPNGTNSELDSLRKYIGKIRNNQGIVDACTNLGVDPSTTPMLWLKSKTESIRVTNPLFVSPEQKEVEDIDFFNLFRDEIKPITLKKDKEFKSSALFDRLVITDIHIGMDVNKDGYALYDGEWNEEKLFERLEIAVNHTIQNKKSNTLVIHDLGDYLDGFDGYTTRGGHKLPQNMDNQQMFDIGLKFKIVLVDSLLPHFEKIQFVNICNDNHAGSFGYIVNSAFKAYIELKYQEGIEVINQRRFIDHYIVENRCFILTHGKDDKSLKFGFKPILDSPQIEKIKNYIDEHRLHSHKIEFSKGDSHQLILDFTSSTSFEYQNFGAFSPPSDWVKTNFKNSISCFTHFNYYDTQKSISNYIF